MGNKPFRVALKLEQQHYVAGDIVQGSVYLSVDKKSSLKGVDGVYLLFEGVEHAEVVGHHHHSHCERKGSQPLGPPPNSQRGIDRSTVTLVRSDHPVVLAPQLRVGQFEYPFQWRLPSDLPTSMRCTKNKKHSGSNSNSNSINDNNDRNCHNVAEIRYTLTAYLATSAGARRTARDSNVASWLPRSDVPLTIAAKPRHSISRNAPLLVESEKFPVNSCWFWNNGNIKMGWQVDAATACPEDTVTVQIYGENQSPTPVTSLTVQWKETITWCADPNGTRQSVTRTLVEKRLPVDTVRCWQPWYQPPSNQRGSDAAQQYCTTQLQLPADARDSYTGRLIQIRHMLVVRAHTKNIWASVPESSAQVRIVRSGPIVAENNNRSHPVVPSAAATSWPVEAEILVPEAQLISTNWGPVVGEAVAIPEAQVVLLDEELSLGYGRPTTTAHESRIFGRRLDMGASTPAVATTVAIEPSAPDESLFAIRDEQLSPGATSAAGLDELRMLVQNSPEILETVLQDPSWVALAKSLSPRDFRSMVQLADGPHASGVARTLARSMYPHFECRHLLACVWSLPDAQRLQVLEQTGALLSDLSRNQNLLEQELSGTEVTIFRQALRAAG